MIKKFFILAAISVIAVMTIRAELIVKPLTDKVTPEDMARFLVGGGVDVFNVRYTGSPRAGGLFCGGGPALGVEKGILLSSGCATNILGSGGTNTSSSTTCENGTSGDTDLDDELSGFTTLDASVLEFDFIPQGTNVTIRYVFSSEEYNEFVDSGFNDVFAFFVNGTNFALVPGTNLPVSIDNVNNGNADAGQSAGGPCKFCQFYIDNANLTEPPVPIEMDGLTTVLELNAPVTPGETNRFKMAIADVSDQLLDSTVFIEARSLASGGTTTNLVTRTANYWFTHPQCSHTKGITTATLDKALKEIIAFNCGVLDLGFTVMPLTYRNGDDKLDHRDAVLEALGLRWGKIQYTGEFGGRQTSELPSSPVCRARKDLAVQYIAALANNVLLKTKPEDAFYFNDKGVYTNFPSSLLSDALAALTAEKIDDMTESQVLLKKFNKSGNALPLPPDIADPDVLACGPYSRDRLRYMARDPSTQYNCPGLNDDCARGKNIQNVPFSDSVDLPFYQDLEATATCSTGQGKEAVWKIPADMAAPFRPFTVSTAGSNFDTVISVRVGDCALEQDQNAENPNEIACNDSDGGLMTSRVEFLVPENNDKNIYIVVEGQGGTEGTIEITITSP
jgi:hypothetical protein